MRVAKRFLLLFTVAILGLHQTSADTVTLSNEKVEITIDSAKGLVLGLNLPGQSNLMWVNPNPVSDPDRNNGWVNYGGDKLWWGPMIDWMSVKGRRLPPDEAFDQPWEIIRQSPDSLTIRSVVSRWVGIRAERTISLAPNSAEIIFQNNFTRIEPSDQRLQLWTISQMLPPEKVLLESHPREGEPAFANRRPQFDPLPYLTVLPGTGTVRYRQNPDGPNMIGTRGSWIAAVYDQQIVVHQIDPEADGDYATDVSVQLFTIKDFIELETLSPNATPKVGESMHHTVRWHVLARPAGISDDELSVWISAQLTD